MEFITSVLLAALLGGILSAIAQLLIDLTSLTPARILVLYVSCGVLLYAIGLYEPLFNIFGEGIALPLTGFGGAIAKGVFEATSSDGPLGILTGGLSATSAGITFALTSGLISSFLFGKKPKRM